MHVRICMYIHMYIVYVLCMIKFSSKSPYLTVHVNHHLYICGVPFQVVVELHNVCVCVCVNTVLKTPDLHTRYDVERTYSGLSSFGWENETDSLEPIFWEGRHAERETFYFLQLRIP